MSALGEMTSYQLFHLVGYRILSCQSPAMEAICRICRSLQDEGPKSGFEWISKYPNTWDLRPNVYDYDPSFIDLVGDLDANVMDLSQRPLVLSHIQVRRSFPGPSYMDWHRDAYHYGSMVGNFPAAFKIMVYPTLGRDPEDRLSILRGSSMCSFQDRNRDYSLISELPVDTLQSSDSSVVVFDTSSFHRVIPDIDSLGSVRVIYSYVTPDQFRDSYSREEVHREAYKRWEITREQGD